MNKQIQRLVGEIIHAESELPPDVLVTVSRVETTENLKQATVWLYVLPLHKAEAVVQQLQKQLYMIQGKLNQELRMRPLPWLRLAIDHGAEYADKIERRFKEIDS